MFTAQPRSGAGRLSASDRAMFLVRLAGVAFAAFQVAITPNQPDWVPPLGYAWAGGLLACAILLRALGAMTANRERALAAVAALGLAVDVVVVMAYVLLYTYDPASAMWAVLFILPLEGAIRFGLAGALWTMGSASVLYTARELWAERAYGFPFLVDSVTYRLGIGFLIALVAGLMSRSLTRERERVQEAYERLREMDSLKTEFLTAASHELRTPLTVISGFAQTLRRHPGLDPARRAEYLEAITRHCDRLTRLANDIIDVSRLERGRLPIQLEPVRVLEVAARAVDIAGQPVALDVPPDLVAWADPIRVEQILFNLLQNAAKYGRPPFELRARALGDRVEVSVADHGDGIPEPERELIFELFYRGSRSGQGGSGIGLTVARRLAEAQGGTLVAGPNEPTGARFTLTVPAWRAGATDRDPQPVPS